MTTALIIADIENEALHPSTLSCITAVKALQADITILVCGSAAVAQEVSICAGVTRVIHNASPCYVHALAENMAALLSELGRTYDYIVMPANTQGKNILPRVSGVLSRPMVSDVTEIIDPLTFVRPIYAGNAILTLKASSLPLLLSIRSSAFERTVDKQSPCAIEQNNSVHDEGLSEFLGLEQSKQDKIDLTTADIVISGGRGLKSKENFALIDALAKKLHAAVGASRAAVDAGFVSNDCQVGQTGKIVAPSLYIAVGISGAIQHVAGMKESKIIVAINQDRDAPIFKIADYGLVADLFEVLPLLEKKL
jgi:electron transfer flavoprotein alpha subunit